MNAGLLVFAVGLYTDESVFKQIGTPALGAALLFSIALFTYALTVAGGDEGLPEEQDSRLRGPA
jgi:hypothetical protein